MTTKTPFANLPALAVSLASDAEKALKAAGWLVETGSSNQSCSEYLTVRRYIETEDDEICICGRIRISDHGDRYYDGDTVTVRIDEAGEDVLDEAGEFVGLLIAAERYQDLLDTILNAAKEIPAE